MFGVGWGWWRDWVGCLRRAQGGDQHGATGWGGGMGEGGRGEE